MTGKDFFIFPFITFSLIFNQNRLISVPMQSHGILHQLYGFLAVVDHTHLWTMRTELRWLE